MRKKNDVGLYYINDPDRVAETAAFHADRIRAIFDFHYFGDNDYSNKKAEELIAKLKAEEPHYNTIKNGESTLAQMRALSIVLMELQDRYLDYGESGDEDDEEEAA